MQVASQDFAKLDPSVKPTHFIAKNVTYSNLKSSTYQKVMAEGC